MTDGNSSVVHPSVFILVGIPGLESFHVWIAIPYCLMYIIALVGNCLILYCVKVEPSLHQAMYFFLCMLSLVDLALSNTTIPKMLGTLWFNSGEIHFEACITQMYFIHTLAGLESATLLAMSYDRYIAICNPLRYTAILTNSVIVKIALAASIRSFIPTLPLPYLLTRLSYCQSNTVNHAYCEHMAVARLSCTDISINIFYGLVVALFIGLVDVILILLSYFLILRAVFQLSSRDARIKAFSTCGAHVCAVLVFYVPDILSIIVYRVGKSVPPHIHILIVNLYMMAPPMINPIVYGVKTKQIRERVLKMFRRWN
ncbi:olfactory receptor 52K1-like [Ambystoma mexicanum]|uniref:olfactory receptor 52K1-like n=1 Tax=Ambystoma mexicanum TaxID=8296 RepID=UPI0037E7EF5E